MVGIPNTKGFIVDGFPRELEQGKEFENEVFVLLMTKVECIFVNWYGQVPRHWIVLTDDYSFIMRATRVRIEISGQLNIGAWK